MRAIEASCASVDAGSRAYKVPSADCPLGCASARQSFEDACMRAQSSGDLQDWSVCCEGTDSQNTTSNGWQFLSDDCFCNHLLQDAAYAVQVHGKLCLISQDMCAFRVFSFHCVCVKKISNHKEMHALLCFDSNSESQTELELLLQHRERTFIHRGKDHSKCLPRVRTPCFLLLFPVYQGLRLHPCSKHKAR